MTNNNKISLIIIAIVVFGAIYFALSMTENVGKPKTVVNLESSSKKLNNLYSEIQVRTLNTQRGEINIEEEQTQILPDISEYPFVVNPTTENFITLYVTNDIASDDEESFLTKLGNEFNKSNPTLNGMPISVGIRAMDSNLIVNFILSEKYTPDAFIPSSTLYGSLLDTREKKYNMVSNSITHNVSGITLTKNVYNSLNSKDIKSLVDEVLNGKVVIGYTNPLSDEDGLNFLLSILSTFDADYILSDTATQKLRNYQDKTPYVSYDGIQLQDSIRNGTIDGFTTNYQVFYSTPALRNSYEFMPYGINQDFPVYEVGELSNTKMEILNQFISYCTSESAKKIADSKGFNSHSDYIYSGKEYDGMTILEAQNLWKKEKNGTSDLTAVFVADISGSMEGSPLLNLKASLNRAATFINENTNVGLITFSDDVNIALPIAKFDNIQKSYFSNAVKQMRASGATAMFDAIIVAEKLLMDEKEKNPNTRLMMFVLTDGENNRGHEYSEIVEVTRGVKIPIYTIGYNADIDILKEVSDINEASTMDADSDNIIYKLESLFNANM